MSQDFRNSIQKWLSEDALPLWLERGIDPTNGSFIENLSREGEPLAGTQRAMVQGRQIYSFCEATHLGVLEREKVVPLVRRATDSFIQRYFLTSGAVSHSVDPKGNKSEQYDLYAQSFALFGLAYAYELTGEPSYRVRAIELFEYLMTERRMPAGGYSEFIKGQKACEANPHMHLFEAALAWMKVDPKQGTWRALADEIYDLCVNRFIDPVSGALCEHFDLEWHPIREGGHFVFEPGHHYEWAWLLIKYQELTGIDVGDVPRRLFDLAEKFGIDPQFDMAFDEVWSHGLVKKRSSRFWPQGERVKAALALGSLSSFDEQKRFMDIADQAMDSLLRFLRGVKPGLWEDTLSDSGEFVVQPVKASSLYHILNAMAEYLNKR